MKETQMTVSLMDEIDAKCVLCKDDMKHKIGYMAEDGKFTGAMLYRIPVCNRCGGLLPTDFYNILNEVIKEKYKYDPYVIHFTMIRELRRIKFIHEHPEQLKYEKTFKYKFLQICYGFINWFCNIGYKIQLQWFKITHFRILREVNSK